MSNIRKDLTKNKVLTAIEGSGGVISTIARRLSAEWGTTKKYCYKWEETRQAMDNENQKILDMCESKLYESIRDGNTQDAKWLLSTRGKSRGYGDTLTIDGGVKVEVTWQK